MQNGYAIYLPGKGGQGMSELDKLEAYLKEHGYTYIRKRRGMVDCCRCD